MKFTSAGVHNAEIKLVTKDGEGVVIPLLVAGGSIETEVPEPIYAGGGLRPIAYPQPTYTITIVGTLTDFVKKIVPEIRVDSEYTVLEWLDKYARRK